MMMLAGCGKNKDFSQEAEIESDETEDTVKDENKAEEKTEDDEEAESDKEMLYIGEIPLICEDEDADGLDMYFQYDGYTSDDYVSINSLTLVNGKNKDTATDLCFNYSEISECYDIKTADNREYIFLDVEWGNDFYDIYEFDITEGGSKYVGEIGHVHMYIETLKESAPDFDDPDNILIADISGALGTCECYDYYHINSEGLLESNTSGAMIDRVVSDRIISNTAMELEVVDADGNLTGEKITVPSGSTYVPVRTNLEDWIDAKIDDGTVVRIHYTYDDMLYEYRINGSTAKELFTGIIYVG